MGKRIISQRRGKGSTTYRAPSFRFPGAAKLPRVSQEEQEGVIVNILTSQAHSAPLAHVQFADGDVVLMLAPEGVRVGDQVSAGGQGSVGTGNTVVLGGVPEGTLVYNIESKPGDGGKFIRSSGTFGRVVAKTPAGVVVRMPSKKQKTFHAQCRACVGVVAGGGRLEKPLVKAGTHHFKRKSKNRLYPSVSGSAMNAVDHPFGNKRTSRKSKSRPTHWNAPPGRKVGAVAARRTGRRKK